MKVTKTPKLISSCYLLLTLMIFTSSTNAQQTKPLQIGDTISNLQIKGLLNHPDVRLKDLYKNRILIINFWATWCAPCIKEMRLLDSLKQKYPSKFEILLVTRESENTVQKFINKQPPGFASHLTIVLADTVLNNLFPKRTIPHNIWIDKNGIIKAITSSDEITAQNILNFNTEMTSKFRVKKEILNFDATKEFHLADTNFFYRSIITPHIPVGNGGVLGGAAEGLAYQRFFQWNASITSLFHSAYSLYNQSPSGVWRKNLIEVHTKDSLRLFYPNQDLKHLPKVSKYKDLDTWKQENTFCYALTLPNRVPDTVFRSYLFTDLERYFGVSAKIEFRNIPCNVVTKTVGAPLKLSVGKNEIPSIKWVPGNKLEIRNSKIKDITNWIFSVYGAKPLPDPFVISLNPDDDIRFDLELIFSKENYERGIPLQEIYNHLNKYGFQFANLIRPYQILVLYDLKNNR